MKSSYQRKNIMLSKRMHGLSCHSSSCNIWLLSYFIDLQIVCICLVCHHSYLYDSSIYLFFLIAFVADVMKKELMFTHTCTWSVACRFGCCKIFCNQRKLFLNVFCFRILVPDCVVRLLAQALDCILNKLHCIYHMELHLF